ncbi:hypothetical protein VE03_02815 [Pseudogymnoascus sp. 23342-1-I1]|nr:hypothetical protein VE03_02815 [Pseudogymnoascus sp. 23342-1-I1]
MKLSVLSAALLPVLIHAQAIPDCATACLSSAIVAASCTPGDNACACTPDKQTEIGAAGALCLLSSCSADEIPAVIAAGSAACNSYFATVSGSATATGSTASGSESSESTAAPNTTTDRSTAVETTSPASTSAASTSPASTSAAGTSAVSTSGKSNHTTVSSGASTTDGPAATTTGGDGGAQAPSSSSTGGAAAMATAFGGVAMALLGVAVAL